MFCYRPLKVLVLYDTNKYFEIFIVFKLSRDIYLI